MRHKYVFAAWLLALPVVLFVMNANEVDAATSVSGDTTLSQNLISYWQLDEESGERADAHGANDLTDNNTVGYATGIIGNGADCEASNSETLSISDGSQTGLDITGDLSVSAWFKPETVAETQLVSKWHHVSYTSYNTGLGPNGLSWINNADTSGYGYTNYQPAYTINTGTWYHLVTVYDADQGLVEFYINGTSVASSTGMDTSIADSAASFRLCARDNGGQYDGMIDEVAIWNKVLTASEVADLYNGGEGLPYEVSEVLSLAARKSTNETVTSSTVLQNDNDLSLVLATSTDYIIDAFIVATSSSREPGLKIAFDIPSGSEMLLGYLGHTGVALSGGGIIESDNTASSEITLSRDSSTVVRITGTVSIGSTGGPVTLKWAQFEGDSAGVTLRKGSYIQATPIE
jgi:hypothetical protein